jgi:hypothetical protein
MDTERRTIFESVKRVRDGNEAHRHAPFARHTMRIPMRDWYALRRLIPDLDAFHDPERQCAAWDYFEKSAFSEPYRVGRIHRGIVKNGVILK